MIGMVGVRMGDSYGDGDGLRGNSSGGGDKEKRL